MSKTISVIIPVYNVERYLPACLDSILSQSYRDLEILLIDDGSKDNSGTLCDEYAAKDARVRVIHQQNGGAAAAKNAGLRAATGEYLTFADSDDCVAEGAYAYMVSLLEEQDADVVQCAHCNMYVDRKEDFYVMDTCRAFSVTEFLTRYTTDWTCGLLWDKLYKRSLYDGVFFEEGHKIDDEYFTYQGIMNAQKIVYSPRVVYWYRKRKSSVMLSPQSAERIVHDRLDYTQKRRRNIIARYPELKAIFDEQYMDTLILLYHDSHASAALKREVQAAIALFLKEKPAPRLKLRNRWQLKRLQRKSVDKCVASNTAAEEDTTDCFE